MSKIIANPRKAAYLPNLPPPVLHLSRLDGNWTGKDIGGWEREKKQIHKELFQSLYAP
jgi:hypothetical protein